MKKENDNNGCAIIAVIAVLLCIWGFSGMVDGHSFGEGIFESIKALGILAVVALVVYGLMKSNDK